MYKDYMLEEYGHEVISTDNGFITFSHHEDGECVIHDLYVRPDSRKSGEGISLCNKVFEDCKRRGFNKVGCFITVSDRASSLVPTYIKYGFKIKSAINNQIVMIKEL